MLQPILPLPYQLTNHQEPSDPLPTEAELLGNLIVALNDKGGRTRALQFKYLFNCTW